MVKRLVSLVAGFSLTSLKLSTVACDTFFLTTGYLERFLIISSERVKHFYPKNVYELNETLFDRIDAFRIPCGPEKKFLKFLVVFDFEPIRAKEDSYKETDTTNWIGRYVPISVFIPSNLIQEPIYFCNNNPRHLASSLITGVEGVANQSKAQMKFMKLRQQSR